MIRRLSATVVLCAVAALTPAATRAQSADAYVGRWALEYEVGRQIENGEATSIRGSGSFRIAKSGDSLLVTIQPGQRPDGSTPPQSIVGGHIVNGALAIAQKAKVRLNTNGAEITRDIVINWTLRARGDAMTGTMSRVLGDDGETPTAPVTGTRLKG